MSQGRFLFTFPRILILLLFFTISSTAQNSDCSSSCGNIRISFPFRLRGGPTSCRGFRNPRFQLECRNNQTILTVNSKTYLVREINYDAYSIRLVDPNINRANLSSCPLNYSVDWDNDWPRSIYSFFTSITSVTFIHCLNPVNHVNIRFLEASFCGNRSSISGNSSGIHGYVVALQGVSESELEPSCKIDRVVYVEADNLGRMSNPSLRDVYDAMASGFEISWYRVYCGGCDATHGRCSLDGSTIYCSHVCYEDTPYEERSLKCKIEYWGILAYGIYAGFAIAGISVLKFVVGFPLLIVLVVYKWRKMKKEDQHSGI